MTTLPNVAILSTKYMRGINSVEDETPPCMEIIPFDTAFDHEYETDAHFVTYTVDGGAESPRLNKPILSWLIEQGAKVNTTMLVLDYDNPGHAEWDVVSLTTFVNMIGAHPNPVVRDYTLFYTTKHGARFVFVLEAPVPVMEGELRLQSLIQKFRGLGIEVDEATKDWTRLFRLPKVLREIERTEEEPLFLFDENPDARLSLSEVPATGDMKTVAMVALEEDQPTDEEARDLLFTLKSGREVPTEWMKDAKRMLHGRESFGCIFEEEPIAASGERNPTVFSYAGQVVALLHHRPGTTAQKCYALLLPAVMQLEGKDGNRSWEAHLWHSVKHAWQRQEGEVQERAKVIEQAAEEVLDARGLTLKGVRYWCKEAGYEGDTACDDTLWDWARQRMILTLHGQYFILRPDGYYGRTPCRKDALPASIRRFKSDRLMDFWTMKEDKDGNQWEVERPISAVMSDHMTTVDYAIGRANMAGSILTREETGQLVIAHAVYSLRTDIKATFNKYVDEWLRALTGRHYDEVIHWLGHSLDFSRPICAMSVVGPPSCGKGMLVRGLAECITTRCVAPGDELVSPYQFQIQRTPFLSIDEGFPVGSFGSNAADSFRRWVGGGALTCNAKFAVPIMLMNPMRIILTANNTNVVRALTQGRTLSAEDRDAIATRIFHWQAPKSSRSWLAAKGGHAHTKGWIDGDDGSPGNAVIARHLLWLHKERAPSTEPRFLVEGCIDADIIQDMALESGIMPEVVECLWFMSKPGGKRDGVYEKDGHFYVLSNAVVEFWNKVLRETRRGRGGGINHKSVGNALRTLRAPGWTDGAKTIDERRGRWVMIDVNLLLRAALATGHDTTHLLALIDTQKETENGT